MSLYVVASAMSAALTETKIAVATSQRYLMELLCRYGKSASPLCQAERWGGRFRFPNSRKLDFGQTSPMFSCLFRGMHKYRLYVYDAEDRLIAPAMVISADNDDAATEQAKEMLDGARAE